MPDVNPAAAVLKDRIQEFSQFEKRIEERIKLELGREHPDAELLRRLKHESQNLKDTLERAKRWADQDQETDLSAA